MAKAKDRQSRRMAASKGLLNSMRFVRTVVCDTRDSYFVAPESCLPDGDQRDFQLTCLAPLLHIPRCGLLVNKWPELPCIRSLIK